MPKRQDDYKKLMRYSFDREIANFHNFLTILDSHLNVRRQELSDSIELVDSKSVGLEESDELRKEWIDLKVETEQVKSFANLLRQSFLTSLYSFMELWLLRECHLDSKRRDGGKFYKATKGKGIEKAKRYFTGVMKSSYPFGSSQDWLWITNFQLLRDCIIHRQGSLTGFSDFEIDSTLAKFVDSESGLNLFGTDNKQIFVEREFCGRALQMVHRFMIEILALETKTG